MADSATNKIRSDRDRQNAYRWAEENLRYQREYARRRVREGSDNKTMRRVSRQRVPTRDEMENEDITRAQTIGQAVAEVVKKAPKAADRLNAGKQIGGVRRGMDESMRKIREARRQLGR